MAQRDRTQGFAFVYVNVGELLRQAKKTSEIADISSHQPPTGEVVNVNKEAPAATDPKTSSQAVEELKGNLDRLQSLHHKLHAMLADLHTTGKKKR